MAEIALAADFPSVRRFNAALRSAFGRTPTDLRRQRSHARPAPHGAPITLRLPYRPPFAWDAILRFLAPRAIPGVEAVGNGSYSRTVAVDGSRGTITVLNSPDAHCLLLTARVTETSHLGAIVERVRRMFDLGADPLEIGLHLSADPLLRPHVRAHPGIRVPGAWDGFEVAVRAVLGQQAGAQRATTVAGRLAREFGEPIAAAETVTGLSHAFPTPRVLARADLKEVGLDRSRAKAIAALSRSVLEGRLSFDQTGSADEAVASLQRITGIGSSAAQYVTMRAMGEPDAFPDEDAGLRLAAGSGNQPLSARGLAARAEPWRPWRAYAAMLLWMPERKTG
jgi:AraC family transcriptional regulator of adaptative response / DNA-3-methyladenine glycosylase II